MRTLEPNSYVQLQFDKYKRVYEVWKSNGVVTPNVYLSHVWNQLTDLHQLLPNSKMPERRH